MAAATGAGTKELMHRLGHASPRAALRYQYATAKREEVIAEGMDRLLEAARNRTELAGAALPWAAAPGSAQGPRGSLYEYPFGVTSLNLGLDDELAARLERRAACAGIAPETLATKAIEEYLAHDREPDGAGRRRRPARLARPLRQRARPVRAHRRPPRRRVRSIALLLDTGPIYAAANNRDRHHQLVPRPAAIRRTAVRRPIACGR